MNEYEIGKLKKELHRKQEQLKEEREDHQHTQQQLVQLQAERDRFYSELVINRQTIEKVETLMAEKMKEIKLKLEQENSDSLTQLQVLRNKLNEEQILREKLLEEGRNKDSVISDLSSRLREMSRKYKDNSLLVNVKEVSDQVAVTNQNIYKLTDKYNKACADIENLLAENKILRKLHGVPENFGFDLEEIKVAEKQELQDYKAQCRKLETEIEELEQERTQLRYRLRQFNTLFSNKGERYKDMNNQQLELLDQYALNLKEGRVELPSLDKTQKEMEREIIKLKGQIEILQNKQAPVSRASPQPNPDHSERLSVEALKRLEEQISKMINPLRQDVKKITETGFKVPETVWQGSSKGQNVAVVDGPQFKPPMPLPIAHNDWSEIKEGFSYLYASKIPIDLKDVQDEAGFSLTKAKYEVAALQLQNMESLKLLREKEGVEVKLSKELTELREKYEKCLRLQDQLFLSYFKEKEQRDEKSRKQQIERNNLLSEKQQAQASLDVMNKSFNSLSKKTDVEKRCGQLTSRLAIAQGQLLKINRKYEVLEDEHKLLRNAYSKLESKAAASEFSLKEKLTFAKKKEKELCFYLNKILGQNRGSVSGEVHKTTLAKLQCLNDQRMSNAIKETELRLKINQLENIEREVTLKEDIIQTLREDNFDISMELEIVKNRLQASDSDYRSFQNVFRKLVTFINHHNVSVLSYFKKFDKDNSGELTKNQFISALKALGFQVTNNQFQLLFNQFDLDGSQSITYREFLRKMRRSGVFTRNTEEEALYRLFKAIKQANITVRKAFQIIDMDGSNEVSKTEMENAFRRIGIDVTPSALDYIFKMCDTNNSGTISSGEFQKLFEDIIRESAIEEKELFGTELDWKLGFILKMEEVSEKYHQGGLKETFKSLDTDSNSSLTLQEFSEFFSKAGIELPKKELLELFNFLDRRRDGKVQYSEFLKILQQARQEKRRVDRMKYIRVRVEELRKEHQEGKQLERRPVAEDKALSIKLLSLQSKHLSLLKKNEKLIKALATREQEINELRHQVEELEKNVDKIRGQYYKEKENSIQNEERLNARITEADSRKLLQESRKNQLELRELRNEAEVYRKLYADLSTKNRYDEMRLVKVESEVQKSYQIVKDLQSLSDPNAELGKKIYELEISKRNQEIVNKKYDQAIEEAGQAQREMLQLSEEVMEKERQIINAHFFFQEKSNLLQHTIEQLHAQILPTLNPTKVQDILLKIRDVSSAKSQLEKENKEVRELLFNLQVRNDYLENQKQGVQELEKKLRRNYTDQASLTIIDLTKKLSEFRMNELRAKRESTLLKEKEEYYLRVNNAHSQNLKEIESELANWQTKYNEREEFWRKRLAEQMQLMEQLQRETAKTKQEQRNAEAFFKEQSIQEEAIERKFEELPESKQEKISALVRRNNQPSNEGAVFELKARVQQLENELVEKEREIYQLKTSFKEIVPQARLSDFAGQMSASTTNFLMQTELTTSQLRNNARRFINSQKDQENYYKQEATKISQAAQQSIDTLQRMIDDKNEQIKRKDQLIDSLRREFLTVKEQDTRQIQLLNEEIRELKTKAQTTSVNEIMNRPTGRNFYSGKGEEAGELRKQLARKEQEIGILQEKYDQLYISKQKKGQEQTAAGQRVLERKLEEVNFERESEKRKFQENEQALRLKIKNLEKLSKEKDQKLSKLQKILTEVKNIAVNEASKGEDDEAERLIREAIDSLTKGKTANDSKMEITMQRAMQAVQQLAKKNKIYESELRHLKEDQLAKTLSKK